MPISVKCNLLLYADDSALFISGKDPIVIAKVLSEELESCRQWLINNKLSLHLGKTESIIFGSMRKLNNIKKFDVTCNGETISPVKSVKYLGVTLDDSLSGESIANSIISKTGARIKFLYRQAHFLNLKSRKTLCSALIQCYFDYCCSSWYSGLSQKMKNRLQVMQNKVGRFILNLEPRSHIGQPELDRVGLLKVAYRVKQLKLNHVFNIFHGSAPDYLCTHFTKTSDFHKYNTRDSKYNFVVPRAQGQACNTFYKTAIQEWNSLPTNIRSVNNKIQFKSATKKHLSFQANSLDRNAFIFS